MNVTLLLILGFSSGVIANLLDPRREGVVGPIILGILGAIMGTVLGNMVLASMGIESLPLESFVIPTFGALGLLLLARLFKADGDIRSIKFKLPKEVKQAWS